MKEEAKFAIGILVVIVICVFFVVVLLFKSPADDYAIDIGGANGFTIEDCTFEEIDPNKLKVEDYAIDIDSIFVTDSNGLIRW